MKRGFFVIVINVPLDANNVQRPTFDAQRPTSNVRRATEQALRLPDVFLSSSYTEVRRTSGEPYASSYTECVSSAEKERQLTDNVSHPASGAPRHPRRCFGDALRARFGRASASEDVLSSITHQSLGSKDTNFDKSSISNKSGTHHHDRRE